jgi:hypothetical protein
MVGQVRIEGDTIALLQLVALSVADERYAAGLDQDRLTTAGLM